MMKKIRVILLCGLIAASASGTELVHRIRKYLVDEGYTNEITEETFTLQNDGAGDYIKTWNAPGIDEPTTNELPSEAETTRWYAATRPTLPMEMVFTGLLARAGVTNLTEDPLYPGRFSTIYGALMYAVNSETDLATKVELHTLSIALDANYQELRRHLDTLIYSPWLGTTNCLMTGPIE